MTTAPPALDLALTGLPEDDHLRQVWHDHVSAWLHALATRVPPHLAASSYSLGLTLCDDAEISHLNTTWRGQEGPTDVLAFALQEDPLPAPPAPPHGDASWPVAAAIRGEPEDQPLELGDIVISTETARRQAEAEGHALSRELLFLASHGLLHLLGWDHPDDPSLAAMLDLQEALLAASAHLPSVTTASCQGEPTG
jgi:probable rRNA maturation factor